MTLFGPRRSSKPAYVTRLSRPLAWTASLGRRTCTSGDGLEGLGTSQEKQHFSSCLVGGGVPANAHACLCRLSDVLAIVRLLFRKTGHFKVTTEVTTLSFDARLNFEKQDGRTGFSIIKYPSKLGGSRAFAMVRYATHCGVCRRTSHIGMLGQQQSSSNEQ